MDLSYYQSLGSDGAFTPVEWCTQLHPNRASGVRQVTPSIHDRVSGWGHRSPTCSLWKFLGIRTWSRDVIPKSDETVFVRRLE